MQTTPYTSEFYDTIREGSRSSARVLVPIALELLRPRSVVDVGCGDGTWLSVFREHGVSDTFGLDGDYVDREKLKIPMDQFMGVDLSSSFSLPRTFDLAVSLEVAEHLPPQSAESFVDSLTKLAPVVLFSAAIPFSGPSTHVNEQWPDYWAALFRHHDYVAIDCIRGRIWEDASVEWWYAQHCLVFAKASTLDHDGKLRAAFEATNPRLLNLVTPQLYLLMAASAAQPQLSVWKALDVLGRSVKRAVRRRIPRSLGGSS